MTGDEESPERIIEKVDDVPLFLVPKAIAEQIKSKGDNVFRILVERKFHHRYSVKIETLDEHARQVNPGKESDCEGGRNG
ncbi:MAG: hypothetical protein WC586_06450 [Methanoregula sp.]